MDPAPPEIYTLSLHDALPIWVRQPFERLVHAEDLPLALELHGRVVRGELRPASQFRDRKSTRLNSSHVAISYAVFCLKKKKKKQHDKRNRSVHSRRHDYRIVL